MAQMEARLKIVAEDETLGAFRAIEQRIQSLSAVSHRVGAEMARVAGSARYLSAYQGPGRLPASQHGLSTRVAAAEAARAGIAPAEGVFGAAAGAGALLGKALPAAIGVGSVVAASKAAIGSFAELEAKVTSLGITAEATDAEVKAAMETFRQLGPQYGVSAAQVSEAAEKYVAAGIDFKQAVEGTPAAIKAAKASGADLSDIVDAGIASMQNLDIEAGGLDRAFDVMAKGGKLGSFELKNMARELPAVASRAKALGLVGEEGLIKIVAMLETTRKTSATGEEAANNLLNFFDKITSNDTTGHFKKMGIDVEKALKENAKKGVDYVTTMLRLVEDLTHGDPFKIAQLFPDRQAREAIMALIKFKKFFKQTADEINRTALGTNQRDLQRQLDTTKSKIDRMSSAWDVFVGKVGEVIAPVVAPALESATAALTALTAPERPKPAPGRGEVASLRAAADDLDRRKDEQGRAQREFTSGGGGSWYGAFGLFGTDRLREDLERADHAVAAAEAAKKKLDAIEQAAAATRAALGLSPGTGPTLGGLPLPPSMRQGVVGAPGVVEGGSFTLDRRFKSYDPSTGLPGGLAPKPQPVRLEGAADIGFTIRVEAPELLKVYEQSRSIVARGALRSDRSSLGVSMSEAAPQR